MSIAYRDPDEGARIRLDALIREHSRAVARLDGAAAVYARRAARAAAGAALTLGGLTLGASVVAALLGDDPWSGAPPVNGIPSVIGAARALGAAWVLAAAAYAAARLGAAPWLRARVGLPAARSGDVHEDLARLEAADPEAEARARAGALERASVALPLAGLALLAPLSIHLLAIALTWGVDHDFSAWTRLSVAFVGHAHLALALCGVVFARKLGKLRTSEIPRAASWDGWRALLITVTVSAVPGAVAFLIPPLLVGVTGLLFVPASFALLRNRVVSERRALAVELAPGAAA